MLGAKLISRMGAIRDRFHSHFHTTSSLPASMTIFRLKSQYWWRWWHRRRRQSRRVDRWSSCCLLGDRAHLARARLRFGLTCVVDLASWRLVGNWIRSSDDAPSGLRLLKKRSRITHTSLTRFNSFHRSSATTNIPQCSVLSFTIAQSLPFKTTRITRYRKFCYIVVNQELCNLKERKIPHSANCLLSERQSM